MRPGRRISGWILAVMVLVAGGLATRHSLASALALRLPQQALQIDQRQPAALALTSYVSLSENPRAAALAAAEGKSRHALAIDPTEILAVVNLALIREARGQRSEGLMRYAEALSRRNLITQLWWIEYWSAKGDVGQTLRHYDIALRTSESAPTLLFPVLVEATSTPEVADALAPVLARRPLWSDQFVQQLAQSGRDTDSIARLFAKLALLKAPAPDRALATVIDRLLDEQQVDLAWSLFNRYRPAAAREPVRAPKLEGLPPEPSAFEWRVAQDTVSVSPEQSGVRVAATSGGGGVALRQAVRLPPGPHALAFEYDGTPESGDTATLPALTVRCQQGGATLGKTTERMLAVVVPQACSTQLLEVSIHPGDGVGGSSATIREVRLVK